MVTIHIVTINALRKGCDNLFEKINYFVSGNTSKGYINYLTSNIKGIKNIIILRHHSSTLKTNVLRKLLDYYSTRYKTEVIHSPIGVDHLAGLIIRKKSTAIITDAIETTVVVSTKEINLDESFNYLENEPSIYMTIQEYMNYAYSCFSEGLAIHDELEKIYIDEMNFAKANKLTTELIDKLLKDVQRKGGTPSVYHRFFGTTTADGVINVLPSIIKNLSHRVYIKGRAGTGKSVFMKKVARACINMGLDTELYHCSFDPDSLDMVLVPELSFCIFDSTNPHELTPEKPGDVVIDLYKETVEPGTDEKYATQIRKITKQYKSRVNQGIDNLQCAQTLRDKVEKQFNYIDENKLSEVTNVIIKHII